MLKVGDIKNPSMLDMNKRVFSTEGLSPTLMTGSDSVPKIIQYKVRKLIPLECWRITGFTDEDYFKAKKSLEEHFYKGKDMSSSQMYKMAGNSICVPVLEHLLSNLLKL
ncbi:DNA cytosine methyltransferase [Clostridium tagluense]|uniref:DNA cytosine methyltransferase n=1 Tax=Clostridium tagluense TaxID=360422 RepID=UPI001CF3F91D|nr:DNA cytosine methyltransferase [Clostridium tagluense]MCB2300412.1 DNA cytosine methyltransferase [Clostridium tagluense]